jgi:hypothetical protein
MQLSPVDMELSKIMLDPNNPRFMNETCLNQAAIQKKIFDTREAKELLSSLKEGIKWVNRIVIRKTSTIIGDEVKNIPDIDHFEYIVVEGNNRLACLKTLQISNIELNTKIPVLEAVKEPNETYEDYLRHIHLTQGIANVMVVKEWAPIAKARHLFKMYVDKSSNQPDSSMLQLNKQISNELGLNLGEVRKAVIRYAIQAEIAKESTTLEESKWPYLEVFEVNAKTRSLFGIIENSIVFEWQNKSTTIQDETEIKHELLNEIPAIIKKADSEGLYSRDFRKVFSNFVDKQIGKTMEDIRDEIIKINSDSELSWKTYSGSSNSDTTDEQLWSDKLDNILKDLNNFPSGADWAIKIKTKFEEISKRVNKNIKIIETVVDE